VSGFVQIGNTPCITKESQAGVGGPSNINGGDDVITGFASPNFNTLAAMRARLTAINGTYYTTAVLVQMTYNDMVYALRVLGP
jgi:hypothetical protein